MGLLSTEVEVTLAGKNIKWFEEKGYYIPRRKSKWRDISVPKNTKICVKVDDLLDGSHVAVECDCDRCGKTYEISWKDYKKNNRNGKTYCNPCSSTLFNSRENNASWNPNKTDEEREIGRKYPKYNDFVRKVLARDNYTCVISGKKGNEVELDVHHLDGYDWCIEGRTDVTNGITLSRDIHKAFHSKYGYGKNTKQQFLEFINELDLVLDDYDGEICTSRWAYCISNNEIIKHIVLYSKIHKLNCSHIYSCCNGKMSKYKGNIYIWYDDYIKMSDEEIKAYIKKCEMGSKIKKICCVNYKLLFESTKSASIYLSADVSGITKCCKGKIKYCGESINKEKLIWAYAIDINDIDDYTLISDDDIYNKNMRCDYPCKINYSTKIVCIEYKTCFEEQKDAAMYYSISRDCLSKNLNGKNESAGKHLVTNEPLHWVKGDKYIEKYGDEDLVYISKEECEKAFLSRNQESSNDGSFIM